MPSNATQQLGTEITKEAGKVTEMERARESKIAELRAAEAKIKEVGHKYSEQVRDLSKLTCVCLCNFLLTISLHILSSL